MNKLNNPYVGGSDEWMIAAFDAASTEFNIICHKQAEQMFPTVQCAHAAGEWELCLSRGCFEPPIEQGILYGKIFSHYAEMAAKVIVDSLYEPEGSYFGTASCWKNAAIRGIRSITNEIIPLSWMINPQEILKDRDVVVEDREGSFFLITNEVPGGDKLIPAKISDNQDSPHDTYLGVVRLDPRGWYRNLGVCNGYSDDCSRIGFEVSVDPVGVPADGSCNCLCGSCQAEEELGR